MHAQDADLYLKVNQAIHAVYFNGKFKDRPVYLDVDDCERQELSRLLSCNQDELDNLIGRAISQTLCWNNDDIYSWHLSQLWHWEMDSADAPPFAGLLLGLSLAAEHMKQDGCYSSNNYYQRLFELLSEADSSRQNKIKHCAKTTLSFWKALNDWLVKNDYEYGIPTAKQVNVWKFVSYAVSQSLVREAERAQLRAMFEDMGISTHEGLSINDVALYLHQWMATSAPSSWLKKIWEQEGLRDRVANAALLELSSCDGSPTPTKPSGASKQLYWVAVKKRFPKKRIQVYLTAGYSSQGAVELIETADTATQKIFKSDSNEYFLDLLTGTDLTYLGPIQSLNLDGILTAPFKLRAANNSFIFSNTPRPIIPLARADAGTYFKEVSRVSMYTEHMLICHTQWKSSVESFLEKHAQAGYSVVPTKGQLPANWCCFEGVVILTPPPPDVGNNLQCLVPITMGDTIQLTGGVWLHHNIWHTHCPPQVIASTPTGLLGVELRKHHLGSDDETIASNIANPKESNFLKNQGTALGTASNMTLVALRDGKAVAERNISFRTADKPRKHCKDTVIEYHFAPHEKNYWEGNGGEAVGYPESGPTMRGYWTSNLPERNNRGDNCGLFEINCHNEKEPQEADYDLQETQSLKESCILRGYHYWDCQPMVAPEDRFIDVRFMQCRFCGSKAFVKRPRMSRKRKPQKQQKKSTATTLTTQAPSHKPARYIDTNTIVDAICYLGAGTWGTFEKVTSGFASDPLQAYQLAHDLSDLGYIDVMTEPSTNRIRRWSVAPATLVITEKGFSYLSGFRSNALVGSLKKALSEFEFCTYPQTGGPDVVGWQLNTANASYIESLIQHSRTPHGEPVYLRSSPASDIAAFLPTIEALSRNAKEISVCDDGQIEKFDPKTNRWKLSALSGSGAYRTAYKGRTYFFMDRDGVMRPIPFEIAKLLAASSAGLKMIGYDPLSEEFHCLVGCQPPPLYRRALVACTGVLPEVKGGKITYTNVPKHVAATLLKKLYEK